MKISVTKEKINEPLSRLQSIITSRTDFKEILSHILIEAEDNQLMLSATNLEMALICLCEAKVDEPGSISISASRLFNMVKNLPNSDSELKIETNERKINISAKGFKSNTQGWFKEDFPQLPRINVNKSVTVPQPLLKEMLKKVSFSISKEETRPYLNGVLIEVFGEEIRAVSTDGHRLSLVNRQIKSDIEKISFVMPTNSVNEILKLLATSGEAKIAVTDKQFLIDLDNTKLLSRAIEQQFPKYENVIPKEYKYNVTINRKNLITGLNLVNPMVNDKTKKINLLFSSEDLKITGTSDVGEAEYKIETDYSGSPFELRFNINYLLEFLRINESENILLKMLDVKSQSVFKPDSDEGYLYVVMPMRI